MSLLENQSIDDVVISKVPERVRLESLAVLVYASAINKANVGRQIQLLFR
jgi:hypothetical protein